MNTGRRNKKKQKETKNAPAKISYVIAYSLNEPTPCLCLKTQTAFQAYANNL